jgi:hypothetical protein
VSQYSPASVLSCAVISLASVLSVSTTFAQHSDMAAAPRAPVTGALTLGAGAGSLGIAFLGALDIGIHRHVATLRVGATAELFGDESWDVALMYGYRFSTESFDFQPSGGVGVAFGERDGSLFKSGLELTPHVGLALQAGGYWRPSRYFALGLVAFGDVNAERSFGGAVAALRLGYM